MPCNCAFPGFKGTHACVRTSRALKNACARPPVIRHAAEVPHRTAPNCRPCLTATMSMGAMASVMELRLLLKANAVIPKKKSEEPMAWLSHSCRKCGEVCVCRGVGWGLGQEVWGRGRGYRAHSHGAVPPPPPPCTP